MPTTPTYNYWHRVVIGIKFASDGVIGNSTGWLTAYVDGVKIYDKARPTMRNGETNPWVQLQNYKEHPATYLGGATQSTIYFAGASIGMTQADVMAVP